MSLEFLKKLLGSRNDRLLKKYNVIVEQINLLEDTYENLSDIELKSKTLEFKERLEKEETLEDILVEAFATVREAGKRVFNMRHYDVQLIGGIVLNDGKIAEMGTGEGKTLAATLPSYLNALTGNGVHVITVNDYLAKRDSGWMGQLYGFLGLSTGVILNGQNPEDKQKAYASDITYGTNNEFGFDYLRDNMAIFKEELAQKKLNFAIIDEVDSILIDEARTPLIISGASDDHANIYKKINPLIPNLTKGEENLETKTSTGDYTIDDKNNQVHLTDQGYLSIETMLSEINLLQEGDSLYDAKHVNLVLHINAALKAHIIFERNKDYIVENNEVVIIDEHTGRKMSGRRWGEGIHQAVEAKEGVSVQLESQTFASITFQNLFRQYNKLAGMTGTADTEAGEFLSTYKLEVVAIPSNTPNKRIDHTDLVFLDLEGKFNSVINEIKLTTKTGQPILVGTASIEMSEMLSTMLTKEKVKHNVLNAKHHEKEAQIIAEAGCLNMVTIATNMAGRGTDIVLGGNLDMEIENLKKPTAKDIAKLKQEWQQRHDQVVALGGLKIIGSERHESRRIDNQLRGRSGRQGDPGETRFYLSLDDDLMRRFASEKVKSMMKRLGMQSEEAIEHNMVTKSIERAQRQVERMHQDERANLLKFDDIANEQRKVVYSQRKDLMKSDKLSDTVDGIRDEVLSKFIAGYVFPDSIEEQWDIQGLEKALKEDLGLTLPINSWLKEDDSLHEKSLKEKIMQTSKKMYLDKMSAIDEHTRHQFEREVLLKTIDQQWREHLSSIEYLRRGIHLRSFAQKDPFQEYRRESAEMFQEFLHEVMFETTKILLLVRIESSQDVDEFGNQIESERDKHLEATHPKASSNKESGNMNTTYKREQPKVGRNSPCTCGSGKKYKQCCGKI